MSRSLSLIIVVLVLGFLASIPTTLGYFYIFLATEILILGLFAASFNLVFGYTGMLSFGHAAFFGIGSYATGMLLLWFNWPLLLCLLVSIVVGALLALIYGLLSVRLNEIYFAMLTLAFGMLTYSIAIQWRDFTGGSDGISGFKVQSLGLGIDLNLANPTNYYYVVLAIVFLATALLYLICHSSFGLSLRAIRLNYERVSFCGLNVHKYRLAAFVISGAFAGLAGGLMAPFLRVASPELMHWTMSAEPVLMTLLGGASYFFGPYLGAALFILLESWITTYTTNWMLILGIVLAIIVIFFRHGIIGSLLLLGKRERTNG